MDNYCADCAAAELYTYFSKSDLSSALPLLALPFHHEPFISASISQRAALLVCFVCACADGRGINMGY